MGARAGSSLIEEEPPKDACGSPLVAYVEAVMKVCSGRNSAEKLRRTRRRSGISAPLDIEVASTLADGPIWRAGRG